MSVRVFLYDVMKLVRGFESDEVVCLFGDLNARVGDVSCESAGRDWGLWCGWYK